VYAAARAANAHTFITNLPRGCEPAKLQNNGLHCDGADTISLTQSLKCSSMAACAGEVQTLSGVTGLLLL